MVLPSRNIFKNRSANQNSQNDINGLSEKCIPKISLFTQPTSSLSDKDIQSVVWDVIVIGGGPAGMLAAGTAAEKGAKVLLLEKNDSLGKKLLITGGGRCNVTNAEQNIHTLLEKYKSAKPFLFSAFAQWGVKDTLHFFNSRNVPTKVEAEQRVFPTSDSAVSIWNALVEYMTQTNVTIRYKSEVSRIVPEITSDNSFGNCNVDLNSTNFSLIKHIILKTGLKIKAKKFILATGGKSRPETGSTGDGFIWLKEIGHTIHSSESSLVPLRSNTVWVPKLAGVTLTDVKISLLQDEIKQESLNGKILFTHVGVTGPTVLNMSKNVGEMLKYGKVDLSIDLLPTQDFSSINSSLQNLLLKHNTKKIKNSLGEILPSSVIEIVLSETSLTGEETGSVITREQRILLMQKIKDMRISITGLLGLDKAIVTSGGVDVQEINFKTMQSKLFHNLYCIGDTLHIDRPSGGFSLQLCWTTGFVAGKHASESL
jgi:predicted Rossmann fold flavoprotein